MKTKFVRSLGMVLVFAALAFLTVAVASADDNLDPTKYDGRINQAVWLGNHAVYCIDHNGMPTADGWTDGGIRVLDGNGQVVFFSPSAEIEALGVPDVNTLVHSENGLALYRQPDGAFSLNGLDEYGNPYNFVFGSCVPIGPVPFTHASIPADPCKGRKPSFLPGPQNIDPCFPN